METVASTGGSTEQVSADQLESVINWTWRDRIVHVWHQLRAAIEEINYVARRSVELQMRLPK